MKYLFVITGIGFGHTTRIDSIIRELSRLDKDAKIRIATFGLAVNYFKKRFPITELKGQYFQNTDIKLNSFKIVFNNLNYPKNYLQSKSILKNLINEFQPDIVISDAQPEGISVAKSMNKKSIYIFNLDFNEIDNKKFGFYAILLKKGVKYCHDKADKIIIPVLTQNVKKQDKIAYVNPIIRDLPGRLQLEGKLMLDFGFKKAPILVTIGGSPFGLKLVKSVIQNAKYFDEEFIIFGVKLRPLSDNVKILPFQPNFLEYLKVCKGIITLAGHSTCSEILFYKKPALIFPIHDYLEQYQNGKLMRHYALIGDSDKIGLIYVRNKMEEFFNNLDKLRLKLKEISYNENGATQAARIILQEMNI